MKDEEIRIRLDSGTDVSIAEGLDLVLATDEPLPCEVCGTSEYSDNDSWGFRPGAREVPVNDLDRDWAATDRRLVRYCKTCDYKGYLWKR